MHKNLVKNSWKSEGLVLDDHRRGAVFRTKKLFQIALVRVWGCQPQTTHKYPTTTKHKNHEKTPNTINYTKTHEKHRNNTKNLNNTKKHTLTERGKFETKQQ